MREISASEASRNFSGVLDSVERGETIVVTRAGKRIAAIAPAPTATGATLNDIAARWCGATGLDDMLEERIAMARDGVSVDQDTDPWTD